MAGSPLRTPSARSPQRPPRHIGAALLGVSVLLQVPVLAAPDAEQIDRWQAQAARTTITRDDWGVPHITAPTDADAVFALMYAQAEDDFPRIEHNYLLSMGRLAEAEGEAQIWRDLRMKLFIDPEHMRVLYQQSPPFLRALMDGWADGLNYYLHTHPQVHPQVIDRFEPWMALTFSEGSIGGDIERISLTQLQAFYEGSTRSTFQRQGSGQRSSGIRLAASAAEAAGIPGEPLGSNGIAIAPAKSANGAPLLLINPHTSFFFRHEAHVTSAEGLNAYGALTWGQFFVYQGFNASAGWMHTSSSVDNIDEFAERVVAGDQGLVYHYGEERRAVEVRQITVPYKTATGMAERHFTTYRTHHGPIVRSEQGRWVAVALMERPMRALMQSYLRTKAQDLEDYLFIMRMHTNSSNNTVFADRRGNIAYLHSNFVPKRNSALDYRLPVDGSDPATDWHGLHTIETSPNTINPPTGWVQNTNNWPYSAAGEGASPRQADYPPYMDIGTENPRGVHALALLAQVEALSMEELTALAFDPALPAFDQLLPPLLAAYDDLGDDHPQRLELAAPIAALRAWDRRWAVESVATSLAVFWATPLMQQARPGARDARLEVIDYMAQRLPPKELLVALEKAVARLESDFGGWRTPWGEINRFQRLNGDLSPPYDDDAPSVPVGFVSGRWGSLASFGSAPKDATRRWYGTGGNSFVAVVEFGERVRAVAITAGGLSREPGAPHFNDQAEHYAEGRLRPVYFWPDELAGHVEDHYHPGEHDGPRSAQSGASVEVTGLSGSSDIPLVPSATANVGASGSGRF